MKINDIIGHSNLNEDAKPTSVSHSYIEDFAEKVEKECELQRFELYLKRTGDIQLAMIETYKEDRKTGKGSSAMEMLIAFADRHGLRIVLTPDIIDGSGTTSVKRLTSFYKKFGFKENKGRNKIYTISDTMYRNPT